MSPERVEPFQLALRDLRARLREGRLPPGTRVTAKDVADELRLSATPVREALSRLAGEGVLEERRGEGFFVRSLTALDIADLYRLNLDVLTRAQETDRALRDLARVTGLAVGDDPVVVVDRLFATWIAEASSRVLLETHRALGVRLAPVRRVEGRLIPDLRPEAETLLALAEAGDRDRRGPALTAFHARRIALAEPLAELINPEGAAQV